MEIETDDYKILLEISTSEKPTPCIIYKTMQMRRFCRRYFISHASILLLALVSTISTMIIIQRYFSYTYFQRQNHVLDQIFLVDESDLEDANIKPTKNINIMHEEFFNTTHLTCRYPKLNIDNQDIWKHLQPVTKSKPDCEPTTNWVYVDNGL